MLTSTTTGLDLSKQKAHIHLTASVQGGTGWYSPLWRAIHSELTSLWTNRIMHLWAFHNFWNSILEPRSVLGRWGGIVRKTESSLCMHRTFSFSGLNSHIHSDGVPNDKYEHKQSLIFYRIIPLYNFTERKNFTKHNCRLLKVTLFILGWQVKI